MVDEVEIKNVGGDNGVASEATLASLTRAIEKLAAQSGSNPKSAESKLIDLSNKARKSDIEVIKKNSEALEENTETVEESTSAFSKMSGIFGILGSSLGYLTSVTVDFAKELLIGGDRLSDFSQHVPIIGSILTPLVQAVDGTIDNFRDLTSVGVDFGGSLFEVRTMAAQSGLSLATFTNTIKNNSEAFGLFLGGARAGARAFTAVSNIVQRDFGQTFSNLGMTMDETAEYTADYLVLSRRLNRNRQQTDQQLANGTAEYVLMLDRLSKITGKQRDQIAADLNEQVQDARIEALMSTLSEVAQQSLQSVLSITGSASPELNAAIKDMVATGGAPMSDFAKALISANPELARLSRGLRDGTVSSDEFMEGLQRAAGSAMQFDERALAAAATAGNEFALAMLTIRRFTEIGEGSNDALDAQLQAQLRGANALLDFERRITAARNQIIGVLDQEGVFEQFEQILNDFVNYFTTGKGLEELKSAIDSIATFFKEFLVEVQEVGFFPAIKNAFLTGFDSLWTEAKQYLQNYFSGINLFGESDQLTQSLQQDKMSALAEQDALFVKSQFQTLTDEETARMAELQGIISELDQQIEGQEGLIGSILGDIDGTTLAIGTAAGVGLVGALFLLGTALGSVAAPIAIAGAGIGIAAGGLGYLVGETKEVIDSLGTAFTNVLNEIPGIIDSAKPLIETAFNGLTSVIEAVGTGLSAPIATAGDAIETALNGVSTVVDSIGNTIIGTINSVGEGIGNVITKITEYKTAGVDATTSQIERLASIPGSNLVQAAEGIERMKTALEGFAPGFWEGLGSFFSFETTPIQDLDKLAAAAPALTSIKDNLTAIVGITGLETNINSLRDLALDAENIENYAEAIEELVEQLRELNEALGETVTNRGRGRERVTTGEVLSEINTNQGSTETLDRLNTTMTQIAAILLQSKEIERQIERNTSSLGNNIGSGRVSIIR